MLCSVFLKLGDIFLVDDSVCEGTSFDHVNDVFVSAKASPFLRGRLGQLEHHCQTGSPAAAPFGSFVS